MVTKCRSTLLQTAPVGAVCSTVDLSVFQALVYPRSVSVFFTDDTKIPVLKQVIEHACLKTFQITRSPKQEVKKYEVSHGMPGTNRTFKLCEKMESKRGSFLPQSEPYLEQITTDGVKPQITEMLNSLFFLFSPHFKAKCNIHAYRTLLHEHSVIQACYIWLLPVYKVQI